MSSVTTDILGMVGMLGLLAFALLCTLRINQNRKIRQHSRKLAARLLNWK